MTAGEHSSTQMSTEQVVELFRAEAAFLEERSLSDFFVDHPEISLDAFLVPLVIADIRGGAPDGPARSPRDYFEAFPQLAYHSDAWMILDASEYWLVEHEGKHWATAWAERYPQVAERFVESNSALSRDRESGCDLGNLKPGDLIVDFEILKFIGEGAFGRVYLAKDQTLQRECALKVTVDQGSEGQVLARLSHPGIVDVYSENRLSGKKILAMRYVSGVSPAKWIEDKVSASDKGEHIRRGVEIVLGVAQALLHAHLRGVLHLDIKPANILLDEAEKPMLSDFNVATMNKGESRFLMGGTVNYMSPEQLQAVALNDGDAENRVDLRSDLYSLGVVLLELLTGHKDWAGAKADNRQAAAHQLLASRLRSAPPNIASYPGVTPSLAAIVDKALQPDPADRYQTALEFETDLIAWSVGFNNQYAANPCWLERRQRAFSQHRVRWIGIGLVLVALLLLAALERFDSNKRLARGEVMVSNIDVMLKAGKLSEASEMLGAARLQLQQMGTAYWTEPVRYEALKRRLTGVSRKISASESQRFTSQFGKIVLREIHSRSFASSPKMIQETLNTFNVLSSLNWQSETPFRELAGNSRREIAERITELILVSMIRSAREHVPTKQSIELVLARLPKEHQDLSIFKSMLSEGSDARPMVAISPALGAFEAYLLGVCATLEDDHHAAVEFYSHALKMDSECRFWTHYRLAFTYQRLQRADEAFLHYGICMGLQPSFAWPKFNLGLLARSMERLDLAENLFSHAIQTDPEFTAGYVALMAIYIQQGKYDRAAQIHTQAKSRGISSPELDANFQTAVETKLRRGG